MIGVLPGYSSSWKHSLFLFSILFLDVQQLSTFLMIESTLFYATTFQEQSNSWRTYEHWKTFIDQAWTNFVHRARKIEVHPARKAMEYVFTRKIGPAWEVLRFRACPIGGAICPGQLIRFFLLLFLDLRVCFAILRNWERQIKTSIFQKLVEATNFKIAFKAIILNGLTYHFMPNENEYYSSF